jgi:Secretion system C-terminal sorting domain
MKLFLPVLFCSFLLVRSVFSQCPSGAMGVSGAGCGCASGCNLTSFGGPNCSPAVAGNCTAGYVDMAPLDIVVPSGCTFTVTATMANRPSCLSSGADGSCQTCDVLRVDEFPAGVKINQQGGSNSTITDSYVLAGPGTIRITGRANRADEIVTFVVTSTGCVDCSVPLPIELIEFTAVPEKSTVNLNWSTASELKNDYFTVERGLNGVDFEPIAQVNGAGTSTSVHYYSMVDSSPIEGWSYYRLKQTDFDGSNDYSDVVAVQFKEELDVSLYPNPANSSFELRGKSIHDSEIVLMDALGQRVEIVPVFGNDHVHVETKNMANGIYFVQISHKEKRQILKMNVQH